MLKDTVLNRPEISSLNHSNIPPKTSKSAGLPQQALEAYLDMFSSVSREAQLDVYTR